MSNGGRVAFTSVAIIFAAVQISFALSLDIARTIALLFGAATLITAVKVAWFTRN
jgi:hypothetical protein